MVAIVASSAFFPAVARPFGADLFAQTREAGRMADASRALPSNSFYDTAGVVEAGKPGKLVRSQPAQDFEMPPGVSATRILYHSRTASNADVIVSGVVLIPYGTPPPGGWPVLAWAHGTSGVGRACAPSLMTNLYYDWEGLFEYVLMGYAIVATDYAGLGAAGRHAYLDMESNGRDVINAVPAARDAVPFLGERWLAIGHSQGGLAVLGVAQLESVQADAGYLGTVSIAGASSLAEGIDAMQRVDVPELNGLVAFMVFGAKTVFPKISVDDVLTDNALAVFDRSVEDGCRAASGAFSEIGKGGILKPGWRKVSGMQAFLDRNSPGSRPARGPIFLATGEADPMFTVAASLRVFRQLCRGEVPIQRRVYPGLSHDPLVYGSLRDQLRWIEGRFRGEPPPDDCASQ